MSALVNTMPRPLPAPAGTSWSTWRLLRTARLGLIVAQCALFGTISVAVQQQEHALKQLRQAAVPGILAANQMRSSLAEMDAAAALELHASGSAPAHASLGGYEDWHSEVLHALLDLAGDPSAGPAERAAVQRVEEGLNRYDVELQRTRDLRGDSAAGREVEILHTELLPAAADLLQARKALAEEVLRNSAAEAARQRRAIFLLAVAVGGGLLWAQRSLSVRTRRSLNPALVVATLLAGGQLAHTWTVLGSAQREFATQVSPSLRTVEALAEGRTAGALVHADALRATEKHQAALFREAEQERAELAVLPAGLSAAEVAAALREGRSVPGFEGDLARAAGAAPSPGLREAVLQALLVWDPAGPKPAGAAGPETAFRHASDEAISLGLSDFRDASGDENAALHKLEWFSVAAGAGVVLLIVVGFAPRLREYR